MYCIGLNRTLEIDFTELVSRQEVSAW